MNFHSAESLLSENAIQNERNSLTAAFEAHRTTEGATMPRDNEPTAEEIAERCREIQATWSEAERWSRMRSDWRASFIRCDNQRIEFDAEDYAAHSDRNQSSEPRAIHPID